MKGGKVENRWERRGELRELRERERGSKVYRWQTRIRGGSNNYGEQLEDTRRVKKSTSVSTRQAV